MTTKKNTKKPRLNPIVVRLDNQDEIFGYGKVTGRTVYIKNPLVLESQDGESGETYVFMMRLNRYTSSRDVKLNMSKVLYVQPMSDLVKTYYENSLALVENVMDDKFEAGITDAIGYMKASLAPAETEVVTRLEPEGQTPEKLTELRDRLKLSSLAQLTKTPN